MFSEETKFFSEIRLGDTIKVDVRIAGLSRDGSRWKMVHRIFKNNEKLAAVITVESA